MFKYKKINSVGNINKKRILLLQGPMGNFFKKLDKLFRKNGAETFRIGFNGGDAFFSYRDNYTPYKGERENWESFLTQFIFENKINQIYLFGDCRFYQSKAIEVAKNIGIDVFVFEEGYIRPHYITMERFGVNDFSLIPRDRDFYDQIDISNFPNIEPKNTKFSMSTLVFSSIVYYLMANLSKGLYPYYRHHRDFSPLKEAFYGVRNLYRKQKYYFLEKGLLESLIRKKDKQYFFVPLQTYNDFQVLKHSKYCSIEEFITEVIGSFSRHAPSNIFLLFKHHPVDRGRFDYSAYIHKQAEKYGISDRIIAAHDIHLPTCLKHAKGTVTINSTVGLSSIYHGTPVITLGRALYDIEGLTNKEITLEKFWSTQLKPDKELFEKYRAYLIHHTQLNASFYGMMPTIKDMTGDREDEHMDKLS